MRRKVLLTMKYAVVYIFLFFGLVSCQNNFIVIVDYAIEFLKDNYTRKGKEG